MCDCSRNNINSTDAEGGSYTERFTDLIDTPNTYAGSENKFVRVNPGGTALTFADTGAGISDFIDLNDCPGNYGSGFKQRVITNGTSSIVYENDTFINNTDCPSSYVSQSQKFVKVRSDELGLEFVTQTIPSTFPDLSDVPAYSGANKYVVVNATNNGVDYITPPTIPTVPSQVFNGAFSDVPSNAGINFQILTTNGTTASWGRTAFTRLSDVPSDFTGQANKLIAVNGSATALTYVNPSSSTTFTTLSDCPSSYTGQASKFVKVKNDETGLHFVAGGTSDVGLLELEDNTGFTSYSNLNVGTVPQSNDSNTGFQLSTLLNVQNMTPRLIQNFIGMRYPSGKPTFNYTTGDAIYPLQTHLFAVYRPNYNDPGTPYLNFFWTSIQPNGGSRMYGPDNAVLDIQPAFEGLTQNHHSCGVKLYPFNNKSVPSPAPALYQNWVMDVEINFSARANITNIDGKTFLLYINTPDFLDDLDTRLGYTNEDKARACDYSFSPVTTGDNYPYINIHKTLTIPCWDTALDRAPIINVFMKAIDSNYNNTSFSIPTYYYINCSYKIIGCRDSSRNLTVEVPGVYW